MLNWNQQYDVLWNLHRFRRPLPGKAPPVKFDCNVGGRDGILDVRRMRMRENISNLLMTLSIACQLDAATSPEFLT